MEKVLQIIFTLFYIIIIFTFLYFVYISYISYQTKGNLQVLAVVISSILASTAMARIYLQNERIEKQKIKRELFDRRLPIIKNIENIVDSFIDKQDEKLLKDVDALKEQFFLIGFLFTEDEIKLLNPFIDLIIKFKTTNRMIDVNKAILYYDEYLKFEIVKIMRITNSYEGLNKQIKNWKKQPKRLK